VGNFPGVTVEKKQGTIRKSKEASVVDLPGIYSLSPYTAEEVVTRDFLIAEKPDGVINIVDATNIERNLYLSLQVMELEIPMVIALNMMDAVQQSGSYIDIEKLKEELGVPIVPISASKNEGIDYLITKAMEVATKKNRPKKLDFCEGSVHRAIHSVAHLIEDHAQAVGLPRRFAATRLVEGDVQIECALKLSDNEKDILNHIVTEMEQESQTDREAALADMRYAFIEAATENAVFKSSESKEHLRSIKIDNILTHKYFAIPIFLLIMALIFWLTFGVIGLWLSDVLNTGIDTFTAFVDQRLTAFGLSATIHSLIIDGVFAGVGSVLTFLPLIIVLFFFLSLLEDSGYMARVAFVMDKLLRKIGLSGRSFVPMLIGFGCSVPAIMATRTLPSARDRKMTILLTPFMSSYLSPIPSQKDALTYLNTVFKQLRGHFYVGGHSKGGNLAVYASVKTTLLNKKRILQVYNNDGPGFPADFVESKKYMKMLPKITTIVPEFSIIGMLLEQKGDFIVVDSNGLGFAQHSPYTWHVENNDFVRTELRETARLLNQAINNWMNQLSLEKREIFVDTIFDIFGSADGEELIVPFKESLNHLQKIKDRYQKIDPKAREEMQFIFDLLKQELKTTLQTSIKSVFSGSEQDDSSNSLGASSTEALDETKTT
jgi:hypothetical protein